MSYVKKLGIVILFIVSAIFLLAVAYAVLFTIMDRHLAVDYVQYYVATYGHKVAIFSGTAITALGFVSVKTFKHLEALEENKYNKPFSGDRIVRR